MSSMEIEMEGSIHNTNVLGLGNILYTQESWAIHVQTKVYHAVYIHLLFLQLKMKEGELITHCDQNNAYVIAGMFLSLQGRLPFSSLPI